MKEALKKFQETNTETKKEMEKTLKECKVENIRSMWYFASSDGRKYIAGSKS